MSSLSECFEKWPTASAWAISPARSGAGTHSSDTSSWAGVLPAASAAARTIAICASNSRTTPASISSSKSTLVTVWNTARSANASTSSLTKPALRAACAHSDSATMRSRIRSCSAEISGFLPHTPTVVQADSFVGLFALVTEHVAVPSFMSSIGPCLGLCIRLNTPPDGVCRGGHPRVPQAGKASRAHRARDASGPRRGLPSRVTPSAGPAPPTRG